MLKDLCLINRGPRVILLIKVVPVHLVHSCCKYFLELWMDSIFNNSVFVEFVDVSSSCVSVVEDKRMAEWFRLQVVCLIASNRFEQLVVERERKKEVFFDALLEIDVLLKKN